MNTVAFYSVQCRITSEEIHLRTSYIGEDSSAFVGIIRKEKCPLVCVVLGVENGIERDVNTACLVFYRDDSPFGDLCGSDLP